MIMGAWRLGRKRLPYDAEVEYLESTGTQWIDTAYKHSGPCEYIIDINGTPTSSDKGILGSYITGTTGYTSVVLGFYGMFIYGFNYPGQRIDSPTYPAERDDFLISYKFGSDYRTLSINGWTKTKNVATYNSENVGVFASGPDGRYPSSIKCRYFKIKDANGVLVRDFQPVCFTNEQGQSEGAMYDRANPTVGMNPDGSPRTDGLYRNRGTGAFLWAEKQ